MSKATILYSTTPDELINLLKGEIVNLIPRVEPKDSLVDRKWLYINLGWRKAKVDNLISQGIIKRELCRKDSKTDFFSQIQCEKICAQQ